jgi:hypothetical protein
MDDDRHGCLFLVFMNNRTMNTITFTIRQTWQQLRHDDRGAIYASQIVLLTAILIIGVIAGAVTLRDAIVQSYGDAGMALQNLNQSYYYTLLDADGNVINPNGNGYSAEYNDTVGSLADMDDVTTPTPDDGGPSPGMTDSELLDRTDMPVEGLEVTMPAISEGGALDTSISGASDLAPANRLPASNEGDPFP